MGRRALALGLVVAAMVATPARADPAPGGPGALSHFDLARKDCVGTAADRGSKVWFTVAGGMLSDVYSPTIDNTNVETLQYVVTDGQTFSDLQSRDMTYSVRSLDQSGMACEVTARAKSGRYSIVTRYVTDPARDAVVMSVRFSGDPGLSLFVRLDPSVNGNGGGGAANGGGDDAAASKQALTAIDTNTVTNAANRDYAVPTALALRADRPFTSASAGFAGTASDSISSPHDTATDGNVVVHGGLDIGHGPVTLALGFGRTTSQADAVAGAAVHRDFNATYQSYVRGWRRYDASLRQPSVASGAYWLSVNVVKASEDKTFPGAIVASLASPWGQAVSAGDKPGGDPIYFGSYREIFARDLYEADTGLLAAGDVAAVRDSVRFLFDRQQLADGRMPRNSLLNGAQAPDTGGDQLDESSYPILLAYQAGLAGDDDLWPKIRAAADFVVAHGPSFGSERWEEQGGFSPSTIAAEIAGLVAAAHIADVHGDDDAARVYRSTADHFQRSIKGWTVTTAGPYGPRYFIRLSRTGDPNAAISYGLGNGSVTADQRSVIDAGFLELVRLGILPADDPDVESSLPIVDDVIGRMTPSGQGFYRYGTDAAGSEDGYGDCFEADPTNCAPDGRPWPTGNTGSGHLWPVLSGERAEYALQAGDASSALDLLHAMNDFASGFGLVPEQDWENAALSPSPFGTPPETASIGFEPGKAAGSASPLTWAQAQEARLALSIGTSHPIEQPDIVRARYVEQAPPAALPLTVTSPGDGSSTLDASVAVTGTTAPDATVTVAATPVEIPGDTTRVTTTAAASDGSFTVTVPLSFGANVLTVAAAKGGATGYARVAITSDAVNGTTVLDTVDPSGDDNGPGTFTYPTSSDFHAGAFDLTRFQVIDGGSNIYLRATLADLTPTFGPTNGAQLLDVFVRAPSAGSFSTAPPFAGRHFTIAPDSAWSERIEVQGFAAPVFVDADGHSLGPLAVSANQTSKVITMIVPAAALGHPASGWVFSVVLHGQDGFSPDHDQARPFAATAQPFQFGLCAPGGVSSICAIDPGTAPKAMDVITPAGTSQATELDPTLGPVTIHGVAAP